VKFFLLRLTHAAGERRSKEATGTREHHRAHMQLLDDFSGGSS